MLSRGVMLDVSGLDGGAFLNPGRVVTPDDLARAADSAGLAIEAGDIVLVRTGLPPICQILSRTAASWRIASA